MTIKAIYENKKYMIADDGGSLAVFEKKTDEFGNQYWAIINWLSEPVNGLIKEILSKVKK